LSVVTGMTASSASWLARGAVAFLAVAVEPRVAGAAFTGFFGDAAFLAPLGVTAADLAAAGFFGLVALVAVFFAAILGSRRPRASKGRGIIQALPGVYRGSGRALREASLLPAPATPVWPAGPPRWCRFRPLRRTRPSGA